MRLTYFRMLRLRSRNSLQLVLWLSLFVTSSSSCAHGPKVQGCVVDHKRQTFDCEGVGGNQITLPLSKGTDLYCFSPQDFEQFMKACKQGIVKRFPTCQYTPTKSKFTCKGENNSLFDLSTEKVDNYFCVNHRDRNRIEERCKS
jgi:hypothetical protein